ncbi:hypothetical protein ACNOYE_30535 [Nannocystaceae bacterium ST9]
MYEPLESRPRPSMPWLLTLTRRERSRVRTLALAGLALAGIGVVALAQSREADESTQFAEAVLSEDFDPSNGWSLLSTRSRVAIPNELGSLASASEADAATFWADVESHGPLVRTFLASEEAREAIDRVERASRRPRFVAACEDARQCPSLYWRSSHQVALLHAIDRAAAGDLRAASDRLLELIRMDRAQLATTRTLIGALVGLANLRDALYLADRVGERSDLGTRIELARAAVDLEIDGDALERPVIVEFLAHDRSRVAAEPFLRDIAEGLAEVDRRRARVLALAIP